MESVAIFGLAIFLAYVYAFVGGFTDAANAIATCVGSRALSLRAAVVLAAVFELLGGLSGTAVAATIGTGLVEPTKITLLVVVAALAGTMTWSILTYFAGIPVSETHGLVGGLLGAALVTSGAEVIQWSGLTKVLVAIVASPILGFLGGALLMVTVSWVFRRANYGRVMPSFRYAQWLSAAYMAFSHGRNDAQKPMGILALAIALYYTSSQVTVPLWIVVSCASVAALGTACGGWRIIRTMGMRITRLNYAQGFASEVAGASVIQLASSMGIPISTTQVITSSILGAGATRRLSAVRWGVTSEIFFSWVLTLPATILLGAAYVFLLGLFFF